MDRDRMNRQGQAAAARRPRHLALATFAFLALALSAVLLATGADTGLKTGSASAATKKQLITGKLSKPGYTVIALARNGRARVKRAPNGAFKLRPPADQVTLHLRASDGTYAGPIVVAGTWNLVKVAKKKLRRAERKLKKAKARADKASGKKAIRKAKRKVSAARKKVKQARRGVKQARRRASGKEVVLGVKPGAELGAISVKVAAGYSKAKLKLRQWKRWVAEENRARAKKGVPIGAGNFGRVRSKNTGGGAPGDLDLDGVADPLDIDRRRRQGARQCRSQAAQGKQGACPDVRRGPGRPATSASRPAWARAAPGGHRERQRGPEQRADRVEPRRRRGPRGRGRRGDRRLRRARLRQTAEQDRPGARRSPWHLGGTGEPAAMPRATPFPECCDSDGDGFGELHRGSAGRAAWICRGPRAIRSAPATC